MFKIKFIGSRKGVSKNINCPWLPRVVMSTSIFWNDWIKVKWVPEEFFHVHTCCSRPGFFLHFERNYSFLRRALRHHIICPLCTWSKLKPSRDAEEMMIPHYEKYCSVHNCTTTFFVGIFLCPVVKREW